MSRHYPAPFTSSNSVGSGLNRVAYIQRESHFSVQDFTIRDLEELNDIEENVLRERGGTLRKRWSMAEHKLFLEAYQLCDGDNKFYEISNHIGTRSKDEVQLHYNAFEYYRVQPKLVPEQAEIYEFTTLDWSPAEDQLLKSEYLSLQSNGLLNTNIIFIYFTIAKKFKDKSVRDIAFRLQWLQAKENEIKQMEERNRRINQPSWDHQIPQQGIDYSRGNIFAEQLNSNLSPSSMDNYNLISPRKDEQIAKVIQANEEILDTIRSNQQRIMFNSQLMQQYQQNLETIRSLEASTGSTNFPSNHLYNIPSNHRNEGNLSLSSDNIRKKTQAPKKLKYSGNFHEYCPPSRQ